MISGDLNQLLKKIKRHRSIQPVLSLSLSLSRIYPSLDCLLDISSLAPPSLLRTIMRALHVEGIICGTGSKIFCLIIGCTIMHDSGAVSTSVPFLALRPDLPARGSLFVFFWNVNAPSIGRWNGKSTTRPGSRVEELERLGMPLEWRRVSDCLEQVSRMDGCLFDLLYYYYYRWYLILLLFTLFTIISKR